MPSFFATLLAGNRAAHACVRRLRSATLLRTPKPIGKLVASEDGLSLIEVVITALIVGIIVVGTLTGLDVAQTTSISERHHNEATVLAAESQEALRSDPATTFNTPNDLYEHVYTKKVDGETYTVTQQASFLTSTGEATACSATNTTRQETNSLRLTSTVSWAAQVAAKLKPLTVSSLTTPPTGSSLEVDIGNNSPTATAGMPGFTSTIEYDPNESPPSNTLSSTTGSTGCVVFAGVPATSAILTVAEKAGYVTPASTWQWGPHEVPIAPNHTTHQILAFNLGGGIEAEFTYDNLTAYTHPNNAGTSITETPEADTFVAYNGLMESSPDFVLGSAQYTDSAGTYTNKFGTTASSTWARTIRTPTDPAKYPNGNLFPFSGKWKVYAGACAANDPESVGSSVTDATETVVAGTFEPVKVPLALMNLEVFSSRSPATYATTAYPVTITNTACSTSTTPADGTAYQEPKETENTWSSSTKSGWEGHLEHPFLPFGKGRICVGPYTNSGHKYYFTTNYELKSSTTEYVRKIYLPEIKPYKETMGSETGVEVAVSTSACT